MKFLKAIFLTMCMLLTVNLVTVASSWEFSKGNRIIREGEILNQDLFFAGEELNIDGEVNGDVYVAASKVFINGKINGDLLALASEIDIMGAVEGDVLLAAQEFVFSGTVNGDLRALGASTNVSGKVGEDAFLTSAITGFVDKKADFQQGLICIGNFGSVNAKIGEDLLLVTTENLTTDFGAQVGGSLQLFGAPVKWNSSAKINGNVDNYTETKIDSAKQQIGGEYRQHEIPQNKINYNALFVEELTTAIALFLLAILCYKLFPYTAQRITDIKVKNIGFNFLRGWMALLIMPLVSLLLIFTMVGIPLAGLLFFIWLILLLFAEIPLYLYTGRLIASKSKIHFNGVVQIILGILVIRILKRIPVVNFLLVVYGMGMLTQIFQPEIGKAANRFVKIEIHPHDYKSDTAATATTQESEEPSDSEKSEITQEIVSKEKEDETKD